MEQSNSKRFALDIELLKRWARTAIIIFMPAIILSLDQIQNGNFDSQAITGAAIASAVDFLRRFVTNYSQK